MSIKSSNIELGSYSEGQSSIMIPLDYISRLSWNPELGQKLKSIRGKTSRRSLAEKLKSIGKDYSHQYIQKLEEGVPESISLDLLVGICEALGIKLSQFIPLFHVEQLK